MSWEADQRAMETLGGAPEMFGELGEEQEREQRQIWLARLSSLLLCVLCGVCVVQRVHCGRWGLCVEAL